MNLFHRGLQILPLLQVCGTVALGVWIFQASPSGERSTPPSTNRSAPVPPQFASMEDLAPLLDQPLRAPLYDPPPPPPPVKEAPPPLRLTFKLVGTIVEGDQSRALLSNAEGDIEIRGVGETITLQPGGIVVEQISTEQVLLKSPTQAHPIPLTIEQEGGS